MIKLKSLLQDAKYVAQKDGASITFDADSDTDAERQAVQMQAGRPKEIDYEGQGPMNPEWTYQDAAGRTHKGHVKDVFDRGGTDVTYAFVDKDTGEYSMVSGSRLKAAKRSGTSPMWVKEQTGEECSQCDGTGKVKEKIYDDVVTRKCDWCNGTGRIGTKNEQGIGFPGVEPGSIPADYPDRKKKVAAARKQADRMRTEAVQFRKGQTVQHFTNPKSQATVVRYDPPKEYPEYGKGSWNNHSFAGGQGLLTVKFPNGHTETDFEGYWKPTAKEDKIVNEAIAWDVFLNGKNIDTVWSTDTNPESMKRSLVNHDGYDSRIIVQPAKTSSRGPRQKKESVQEGGVWDQVCPKCGKKPPRELRVWSDQSKCPLCSTPYNSTTNEAYKALRPLRKLIREELQQMLKESVVLQGTYQGFMISYSGAPGVGGTASVTKRGVPKEKFDDELSDAYKILSAFRATKSGSTWGTDGIGYIMNKEQGLVNVKKSGVVAKNAKAAFASLGLSV